jgi:hypothetical protein
MPRQIRSNKKQEQEVSSASQISPTHSTLPGISPHAIKGLDADVAPHVQAAMDHHEIIKLRKSEGRS